MISSISVSNSTTVGSQWKFTGLGLRQQQQVSHHAGQAVDLFFHHRIAALYPVYPHALHDLGVALDHGERRAQFVADIGHEAPLQVEQRPPGVQGSG